MDYIGETLWVGRLGHGAILVGLSAIFFSGITYFLSAKNTDPLSQNKLKHTARSFFFIHSVAVLVGFFCLYTIIRNHLFEYYYAYQHSGKDLPVQYILSCFWEGQEGSFLLWIFWNIVLSFLFIFTAKRWENKAMPFICLLQCLLGVMLLGIYVGELKIGSSPFTLLRNEVVAPIFSNPNYLDNIRDGRGLNALLQNYWMVIHPPVLFLGFSSVLFPFALGLAALTFKEYEGWIDCSRIWAIFSAGVLGLGIMMGAAWAYESLAFGGYWAWDPVENASLVPWLLLIASLHCNVIYIRTKRYLRLTFIGYILSFLSVLYSTYLTRSGVLGETSVHSFTNLGMDTLLLSSLLGFVFLSLGMYVFRRKNIPTLRVEENTSSREFYMFLGSVVLFLSALIITLKTSLPVVNKVFHTRFASPEDVLFSFNSNQIVVALAITLLSGFTMFLRYKRTVFSGLKKKLLIVVVSVVCFLFILTYYIHPIIYTDKGKLLSAGVILTYFGALFSIVANGFFILRGIRKKGVSWGSSLTHFGFALLIIGILVSATGKKVLSWNTTGFSPLKIGESESPLENLTLIKNRPADMGDYKVTYLKDSSVPKETKIYYNILFNHKKTGNSFVLSPDIIENTKGMEGVSPNPDARHFWNKDIFVYLTYLQEKKTAKDNTSNDVKIYAMKMGDTVFYSNGFVILDTVTAKSSQRVISKINGLQGPILAAKMRVSDSAGNRYTAEPFLHVRDTAFYRIRDTVFATGLVLELRKILKLKEKIFEIGLREHNVPLDFITLKVYEFPFIMLLWTGVIIMTSGFALSFYERIKR